jgi:hypothetical protein
MPQKSALKFGFFSKIDCFSTWAIKQKISTAGQKFLQKNKISSSIVCHILDPDKSIHK